jgi:hypothetical protein
LKEPLRSEDEGNGPRAPSSFKFGDDSAMTNVHFDDARWPDLPWREWEPTVTTVHHWLQVVGRVRMVLTPRQPHWGHAVLEVSSRGISTRTIPYVSRPFSIDVDFVDHHLKVIEDGAVAFVLPLLPMSVARFYAALMAGVADLGIEVRIPTAPAENPTGTPLDQDEEHASYEPEHALRMWQGFAAAERALQAFRQRSGDGWTPPRLFWGSLDLATSRYDADPVIEHAAGWWPTSPTLGPAFYAYTKPEPEGYRTAPLEPAGATFDETLGEFILTSEAALRAPDDDDAVLRFLLATAAAGGGA